MITMRRVGDILRQTREKKKLTITDVALATRIKASYLEAIEKSHWQALPQATFTKGLIRNYAKFLGLQDEEIVAGFRREFDERKAVVAQPPKMLQVRTLFHITPATTIKYFIAFVVLAFCLYFIREYRILTGPPKLAVSSPQDNVVLTEGTVVVTGKTTPEAVLTINEQPVALQTDGSFKAVIEIMTTTTIRVTATAKSGKDTTIERTVLLENRSATPPAEGV